MGSPRKSARKHIPGRRNKNPSAGLFTPSLKISPRAVGWPAHEVDAILKARIAGKSDEEIRALVSELIAARAKDAPITNAQILRLKDVRARLGLSRSTIYSQCALKAAA